MVVWWNINFFFGLVMGWIYVRSYLMKIGMFICGYQRLFIEYVFCDVSELGYDGIEIWGGCLYVFVLDLKVGGIK